VRAGKARGRRPRAAVSRVAASMRKIPPRPGLIPGEGTAPCSPPPEQPRRALLAAPFGATLHTQLSRPCVQPPVGVAVAAAAQPRLRKFCALTAALWVAICRSASVARELRSLAFPLIQPRPIDYDGRRDASPPAFCRFIDFTDLTWSK
jgi:hypothetical protein